ncbi:hypothetical protein UlMin_024758 [Ulmus minor]
MYKDLKEKFWWFGMKGDVAKFVEKCLTCQRVKAEHQRPAGELQLTKSAHFFPIKITYSLEQLAEFYQATIGMAPYEALYGRKCRSPIHWYETGEKQITAPDFIETTTEAVKKIRERMETAQSR